MLKDIGHFPDVEEVVDSAKRMIVDNDCLTSKKWWSQMEVVLKAVSPIFSVLRLADQQ
jgi:hypothetical protein